MHLAPLFGGTLISCAVDRPRFSELEWLCQCSGLQLFLAFRHFNARCLFSLAAILATRTPFSRRIHHVVVCFSLLLCTCILGQHQNSVWLTSREKIASLMFGRVCRNGQARSRSINYFHAYRMQIVQSDFIYRRRTRLMDSYYLYALQPSACLIIWNSRLKFN